MIDGTGYYSEGGNAVTALRRALSKVEDLDADLARVKAALVKLALHV